MSAPNSDEHNSDEHNSDEHNSDEPKLSLLWGATLHTCDEVGVINHGGLLIDRRCSRGEIAWVGDVSELRSPLSTLTSVISSMMSPVTPVSSHPELIAELIEIIDETPRGSRSRLALSPEVTLEVISCAGEHICPGFIDARVDLGPILNVIDDVWPGDPTFESARRGGVTTICVSPSAPRSPHPIIGVSVALKTSGIDVERMCLRERVCLELNLTPSGAMSLDERPDLIRDPTRATLTSATRHAFEGALRYEEQRLLKPDTPRDDEMEALVSALRRELPVRVRAARSDEILIATRLARDFGFKLVIDHGDEAHLVVSQLRSVEASVICGPPLRLNGHLIGLSVDPQHPQGVLEAGLRAAQTSAHPIAPAHYLSLQAGMCMRSGLSAEEALKLITAHPADILGVADRVGRLAVGLDADLLRLSGAPLDIQTRVLVTYIEGVAV